ncbi:MAG TPA: trypsin-like peptidase domain-containing protein [Candidatus Desulfaltia sp.]|nr:trypsin-like peptidase domain-containing protein [Candidatus Desulfaltia sp.]
MSEEWFYGSKAKRNEDNRLWAIVVIFMILNVGVLAYVTYFGGGLGGGDLDKINTELDSLRFQLNSAQLEIQSLRNQLKAEAANYSDNLILTQLYNRTKNSVVLISVRTASGGGTGSGFVYDKEGRIITNNHVVKDATRIEVYFLNGRVTEATLVGTDPYSDMAIIDVNIPSEDLVPVRLGKSSDLLVGEYVVAIGNPFGLANTMTMGIVSALGRQSSAPGNYVIVDVIQTDAAINPGNSGGPLLNLRGEVMGMNTWILSDTGQFSGIGFAVPSDTILREIGSIIDTGTYQHPWIGVTGRQVTPALAEAMNMDRDTRGTLVVSLTTDGPAAAAGLIGGSRQVTVDGVVISVGGDVIIGADARAMNSFYDLIYYVESNKRPGDVVRLTIIRGGELVEVDLTLGVRPPS